MILAQIYILVVCFVLGARDGVNYSIYGVPKTASYPILSKRLKVWHAMGSLLYLIATVPLIWITNWYILVPIALLRLSVFDIGFNIFGKLSIGHIGTEAFWDKKFSKVFGYNGAVKKAIIVLILIIGLNILYGTTTGF